MYCASAAVGMALKVPRQAMVAFLRRRVLVCSLPSQENHPLASECNWLKVDFGGSRRSMRLRVCVYMCVPSYSLVTPCRLLSGKSMGVYKNTFPARDVGLKLLAFKDGRSVILT